MRQCRVISEEEDAVEIKTFKDVAKAEEVTLIKEVRLSIQIYIAVYARKIIMPPKIVGLNAKDAEILIIQKEIVATRMKGE